MALDIFITFLLVFLNGFFVAAEFAIVKVRASQLELKIQSGNRFAVLAKNITSHLDSYLAATQLGITLASLGLGWIGEPVVSVLIENLFHLLGIEISADTAHDIALPVAFAIITILHIVFGELAPKSIAIQRSEKTTLIIAYPLQLFYIIFKPFILVLNGIANVILKVLGVSAVHGTEVHSSDELKYLVQQSQETGTIEIENYSIIKNAFDFSERTARQIMIPRTRVLAISVNDFTEEMLEKVIEENYSRIPCYEDNVDNIIGVVYLKDILMKMRKNEIIAIREIMRPVMIIPETKHIGPLLKDFQARHQQIAIVVDEYGSTKGIITMEDILEELVGQIQDEYDIETPVVEKTADKIFKVVPLATIKDINELLPHPIEENESYDTLAGFLIYKFRKIPETSDKIISKDYEFTILKKNGSMITLVQLKDLKD
jgi:CBS domain containing-hemolysin-like protein